MANSHCMICGGNDNENLSAYSLNLKGKFLSKCRRCNLVFQSPWESNFNPELYEYYNQRSELRLKDLYNPLNELRYIALLDSFKKLVKGRRILDIGCGEGHFVSTAIKQGWLAIGTELSRGAWEICKRSNLPVYNEDIYSDKLIPSNFDLITCFEVIEHLADPIKFIKRAEELLKPSGVLYLTTPNFNSLDRRVIGRSWRVIHPEHLLYFTPVTIRDLINQQTGFKVISLKTVNISAETLGFLWQGRKVKKEGRLQEQRIRSRMERSGILKIVKDSLNRLLDCSRLGSTIHLICVKN